MNLFKSASFVFILIISCTSSIYPVAKYKAIPLAHLVHDAPQGVSFAYRIFNRRDCTKYLGRDLVITQGYQPVQVQITNNSNKPIRISPSDFSFPCVPYEDVANQICFNTTKRVIAWGVPGLFVWPLLIPAFLELIEAPVANEQLYADYSRKALTDTIIEPFKSVNAVIFVAHDHFDPDFSFTIIDATNKKHILSTVYIPAAPFEFKPRAFKVALF